MGRLQGWVAQLAERRSEKPEAAGSVPAPTTHGPHVVTHSASNVSAVTKKCRACGIEKDLSEFNRDRTKGGGYKSRCRVCLNLDRRRLRRLSRAEPEPQWQPPPPPLVDPKVAEARRRALRRLVEENPREFRLLLDQELRKMEIEPEWRAVS